MNTDAIQITYEEGIENLPLQLENKLTDTIQILLKKIKEDNRSLSIHFCSPESMAELNNTYRNKPKPTDLLSWLYDENDLTPTIEGEPWGELVYCLPIIQNQAADSGWELQNELLRLTVHGLVHLMGYDHETDAEEAEMLGIEKNLLEQIGLAGVYSG